jgi:thioredoxin reductase
MGLLDFVDLDIAVEPDQFHLGMAPVFADKHLYRPYVEAVRGAAGNVPVLSVLGRLTSVADAEQFIASGLCDMVGAARAVIAEPELVKNAFEGKEERSRTCISCNWCMAASQEGAQGCAINPASYRERHWGVDTFTPAARPAKVVVIGAGPGGLEAARVSALRGHDVAVLEARDHLGGAFALWTRLPGRAFYGKATEWWARELKRLGVKIHLNTTATAARVLAEKPDAVIVATGARYSAEGRSNYRDYAIPGHDKTFVYRPEEILLGRAKPTGKIVVQDAEGWHGGVGIAEFLALAGAKVELLTPYFSPMQIRLSATQEAPYVAKRLRAAGVALSATAYIKSIGDHAVTVGDVHGDAERVITGVDAVVLTTGRLPVNDLEKDLDGKVAQLFVIGDALAVRVWASATYEGQRFARLIGEPNAPATVADLYFAGEDPNLNPMPADVRRIY